MTKLRAPVREQLADRVDESTVQRVWSHVRARRGGSGFAKRRTLPAWSWSVVTALSVLVVAAFGVRWQESRARPPLAVPSGPLVSKAGAALSMLGSERTSNNELSDGSSILLDSGSRLEVLENTSKTFVSVLRSGRGAFAVRPGGPRRWTVEAGLATVEVVGTRFSVTRLSDGVEVSVEHGVVLVRSELIQDHVQRLSAGQKLSIHAPHAPHAPNTPAVAASLPVPAISWPLAQPGASAVESTHLAPASLEQLLGRANEQRRQGDVVGAEASLRRALSEHASEPQAALAAFTLGKLLSDVAGRPSDAAWAFARCLAMSPPSALAEDALFRLAEAQTKAGDRDAASESAREYASRYPQGRHGREVGRWIAPR
jgi:transmembrane sensor